MGYREIVLGDKPLRYYRLGETSGTVAVDSVGTSNGTYQTGGTLGVTGLLTNDTNKAYAPNGAGGVTAATPTSITGDFSAEFWFTRPSGATNGVQLLAINAGSPNFYQTFLFNLGGYSGGATNKLALGYGSSPTGFTALFGPVITLGHTYHIVGTYQLSSQTWTLYVDGAQYSQRVTSAAVPYNQAGMVLDIGFNYNGGSPSSWFDGTVDEAAVYNRVLGPSVVAKHYNAGKGKFQTGGFFGMIGRS